VVADEPVLLRPHMPLGQLLGRHILIIASPIVVGPRPFASRWLSVATEAEHGGQLPWAQIRSWVQLGLLTLSPGCGCAFQRNCTCTPEMRIR
jgi:hypothetical protein